MGKRPHEAVRGFGVAGAHISGPGAEQHCSEISDARGENSGAEEWENRPVHVVAKRWIRP